MYLPSRIEFQAVQEQLNVHSCCAVVAARLYAACVQYCCQSHTAVSDVAELPSLYDSSLLPVDQLLAQHHCQLPTLDVRQSE